MSPAPAAASATTPGPDAVPPPQTIDRHDRLVAACAHWRRSGAIALDTEFVRERTFFPQLGLVQVGDRERNVLVDPLAIADLTPLAELLSDRSVTKVLHSASEDLEVFYRRLGVLPEPLFDTQVAASLVGLGASLGYRALVAELFGHDLPKGETRTNWLRRPLSEAQERYAAQDVVYLLPAYDHLLAELRRRDREPWLREEIAQAADPGRFDLPPAEAYLRIRGAGRLDRRQLAVLRELAAWREEEARARDLPRNFVVTEAGLVAVARSRPQSLGELQRISALKVPEVRRHGAALLAAVAAGQAVPADQLPEVARPPRGKPSVQRELMAAMKDVVRERAAALDLPPEVLASGSVLKDVLYRALEPDRDAADLLPPSLASWRRELLAAPLADAVSARLR